MTRLTEIARSCEAGHFYLFIFFLTMSESFKSQEGQAVVERSLDSAVKIEQQEVALKYGTFDPRPLPIAEAANNALFELGPVLGIEVTVPALAARCELGNLDPQHTGQCADLAAIEVALDCQLPPSQSVLATVRADLDAVGAMAIIALRLRGEKLEAAHDRITLVALSDRFAKGEWQARPLPTKEQPWPESPRTLAAVAAMVSDFKKPLAERVALMEKWLLTGEEPAFYREQVDRERQEMVAALERGDVKSNLILADRVALVESSHRAAMSIGYSLAPVVIARNPAFRLGGGEPHVKYTIGQFAAGYVDLKSVFAELSNLEAGWGGSPTVGGSPQGVSSKLTQAEVSQIVERHLLQRDNVK